jgi:hypothetical protein
MAKSKRKDNDETVAVPFAEAAEKTEETITEPQPSEPVAPSDFAMSLEEYGICRGLKPSVTAGLRAFLRGDARPRKLSAWDGALERFQKA